MHVAQDLQPWMEATPQPVAVATGRVVRAIGSAEKLDACIKAAEIVARFVAVAALASSAATRPGDVSPPEVENFVGNLSFGVFENAARTSASVNWNHPLRGQLRRCFKKRQAVAGNRLAKFVELRNELGHAITPADEARARALLERADPIGGLIDLLEDLKIILAYPLLALLGQEHRRGRFLGRFAFFSGEGEPIPQELELRDPLYEWESPYLCTPEGLIPLMPGILYQPRALDGRLGLYLLDGITEVALRYKSIQDNGVITRTDGLRAIGTWMQLPFHVTGKQLTHPLIEPIACLDGRSLYGYLSRVDAGPASPGAGPEPESHDQPAQADESEQIARGLPEFERIANGMALGSAYRDILYCFATHDSLTELSDGAIRIMPTFDPTRVVATIEVIPTKKLRLTIFVSALTSDSTQEAEVYDLSAGESADEIVERVESLIQAEEPGPPSE